MATVGVNVENGVPFWGEWKLLYKTDDNFMVMYHSSQNGNVVAPLCIHKARLFSPRNHNEGERLHFISADCLHSVSDKLKYYRYQKGLLQSEVAKYACMDRGSYTRYEEGARDYYPIPNMEKIAELFDVNITDLLDEYNLFLYSGQGQYVKSVRKRLGLTQAELAKRMDVQTAKVKRWEQNKVRMFKGTWEKLKNISAAATG